MTHCTHCHLGPDHTAWSPAGMTTPHKQQVGTNMWLVNRSASLTLLLNHHALNRGWQHPAGARQSAALCGAHLACVCAPQVHTAAQAHCQQILCTPVHQVKVEVISKRRCVQHLHAKSASDTLHNSNSNAFAHYCDNTALLLAFTRTSCSPCMVPWVSCVAACVGS